MRLRVLGCSGGSADGARPTSFLLEDRVAIDAGSIAAGLSTAEQAGIEHVLLSHVHLDHIRDLPLFIDNRLDPDVVPPQKPITLWSAAPTLDAISAHIFNGALWPALDALESTKQITVECRPISPDRPFRVANLDVRAFEMDHPVPCLGFLIDDGTDGIFIAGDTGSPERVRDAVSGVANVRAIVIEVSWPNRMHELAGHAGHIVPERLAAAAPLHPTARILITHIKPYCRREVIAELEATGIERLEILEDGMTVEV